MIKDETGNRYGKLLVTGRAPSDKQGNAKWNVACDCGNESAVLGFSLRNGSSQSCGCVRKQQLTKHGQYGTPTYDAWVSMKGRCLNKKHKRYKDYGDRGITVCDRWLVFENFLDDMREKPEGLTLERIDNSKGYSKENCKWASLVAQNNNRRNTILLSFKGKMRPLREISDLTGLPIEALRTRVRNNWSEEDIFSTPYRSHR